MKNMMFIASALLTLGLVGCDRSSSPSNTTAMPASAMPEPDSTATGGAEPTGTEGMTERKMEGMPEDMAAGTTDACPIAAQSETITSVDVPNGAALVFQTADPQAKTELRQQLETIAATESNISSDRAGENETGSGINVGNSVSRGSDVEGGTEGRTGFEGPGDDEQPAGWVKSADDARAEETNAGVQLVFTTKDDVEELRSEVRERATDLNQRCAGQ